MELNYTNNPNSLFRKYAKLVTWFSKKNNMKNILVKTITEKKEFSYKNGICNLSFTLRVDNTSELKDFRSCLEAAMSDIDEL